MMITITRKQLWISLVVVLLLIGIWIVTRPAAPPRPSPQEAQRTEPAQTQQMSDGIDVQITRLPQTTKTETVFRIALNTHSGDLSVFNAATNVTFQGDDGAIATPIRIGGNQETHHRTIDAVFSTLRFPGMLLVKNLGSLPERSFSFSQ